MFCRVCPQYFHVKAVHGGELLGFIGDDLLAASLIRPQTGERIVNPFATCGETGIPSLLGNLLLMLLKVISYRFALPRRENLRTPF